MMESSNGFLQFATVGPVADLRGRFDELTELDRERTELIRVNLARSANPHKAFFFFPSSDSECSDRAY